MNRASGAALLAVLTRVLLAGHRLSYDSAEYRRGARALLGDGDYATVRYPPGFPAMLSIADVLGAPDWWVTTASGLGLVTMVWCIARRLGGPQAAIAAAVLCLASPLLADSGVALMADTPAALFAAAAVLAGAYGRWLIAGVLIAVSSWIRMVHFAFTVGLLEHRRAALVAVAGVVPLAVFNLSVFGSLSTYAPNQIGWSVTAFTEGISLDGFPAADPNWIFYPAVLLGRWGYLVPLLPVFAGLELWRRREEPVTYLAVAVVLGNLVAYAFYYFQSPRFVLPTAAVTVAYAAVWLGQAVPAIWSWGRSRVERPSRPQMLPTGHTGR